MSSWNRKYISKTKFKSKHIQKLIWEHVSIISEPILLLFTELRQSICRIHIRGMHCFVTCFVHYKTPLLTFGYWDNYAAAHIWVMNSPGIGPFARPYQFPYVHHYSLTQCINHHSHHYITWVWIELNKSSEKFWRCFQSCLNRPTLFWYNYGWNCWTSWIVTWMFAILWQCYGSPIFLYCFIISHYSSYYKNDRSNSGGTLRQKFNLIDI